MTFSNKKTRRKSHPFAIPSFISNHGHLDKKPWGGRKISYELLLKIKTKTGIVFPIGTRIYIFICQINKQGNMHLNL